MKSILFYWSKGAAIRRRIILLIRKLNTENKACFLNTLADKLRISHVGVKKHIDILIEEGYVKQINPKGKPIFLKLSRKGSDLANEVSEK